MLKTFMHACVDVEVTIAGEIYFVAQLLRIGVTESTTRSFQGRRRFAGLPFASMCLRFLIAAV